MSKLINALLHHHIPASHAHLPLKRNIALAQEAHAIFHDAAENMRTHRQGFFQEYRATVNAIDQNMLWRVTQELAVVNLRRSSRYRKIQQALESWNPALEIHPREGQAVKQALALALPAAQQRQKLQRICDRYKGHLQAEILDALVSDHSDVFHRIEQAAATPATDSADRSQNSRRIRHWEAFFAREIRQLAVPENTPLKKAIQKYDSICAFQETLQTAKPVTEQIQDFKNMLIHQKTTLEMHRDSLMTRFLKVIAAVLTLGMAVAGGIFDVKGEQAVNDMQGTFTASP